MRTFLLSLALAGLSLTAAAQTDDLEKIRNELEDTKKRLDALEREREKEKLEAEVRKELEGDGAAGPKKMGGDLASADLGGGASARLVDLSVDLLLAAGSSTARDEEIERLQFGGHDPNRRGFTLQNLEISALGAVDPYFNGEVHLVYFIDREGESVFELEEAFFTTTSLPAGLQVRGGQMFLDAGRQNRQHPHAWAFVDQPVVNGRFFGGDGLRSTGAQLSWLAPTPWFLEVSGGVYNAGGETAFSFVFEEEEELPVPALLVERGVRNWRDLLYHGRVAQSFDIGDTITTNVGLWALHGPNSTGLRSDTDIFGADVYARWKPLKNDRGWPFVSFQGEVMMRRFERGAADDGAGTEYGHAWFQDWGWYAQLAWGFAPRWTAGARVEWADGEIQQENFLHDARLRLSPALTFYPTEFSKIRLQYNYDHASHIRDGDAGHGHDEHSVWLQVEILLGKHGAHKF